MKQIPVLSFFSLVTKHLSLAISLTFSLSILPSGKSVLVNTSLSIA